MAFTYGFYNSLNGDRKYDAEDMSRIFDGLITDGVISGYGNTFNVQANNGNTVSVDTGRAWFDHTWNYNNAQLLVTCEAAEILQDRYDAVVLEVNNDPSVRENTIKVIKGTAAVTPVKPTLTNSTYIHQYPLAYIYRKAESTAITQANIENAVGTSECPLCTAMMTGMSADQIIEQWRAAYEEWQAAAKEDYSAWKTEYEEDYETWETEMKAKNDAYISERDNDFGSWFKTLVNQLSDNQAANLQNQINKLATVSARLTVSGWSNTAPYTQRVSIATVTADRNFGPMYFAPTGNADTDAKLTDALECLSGGVTGDGYVEIYCYEAKPSVDITVLMDGRI